LPFETNGSPLLLNKSAPNERVFSEFRLKIPVSLVVILDNTLKIPISLKYI